MYEQEVKKILRENIKFTDQSIDKLKVLEEELLKGNKKHNLISNLVKKYLSHIKLT